MKESLKINNLLIFDHYHHYFQESLIWQVDLGVLDYDLHVSLLLCEQLFLDVIHEHYAHVLQPLHDVQVSPAYVHPYDPISILHDELHDAE